MASLDHRLNPLFSIKECMTCGALYTRNCGCSKGSLEDKILVPVPDSSQRPPQNCATCGDSVDGLYCRPCAFLRKCLNEGWYTIHDENEILNTSESSNDNTNIVSAPQEPFVVNQDPIIILRKGSHTTFRCQPMNQDFYNSNLFGFDQFQPPQFPVNYPPQETSKEILQAQEDLMEAIQAFLKEYDHIPPNEKCMALLLAEERFLKIKQTMEEEQNQPGVMQELLLKLMDDLQILRKPTEKKGDVSQVVLHIGMVSMYGDEKLETKLFKGHALMDKQYQQEDIQELMSKLLKDVQNISEEFSEYINCPSWNRPLFYFDDDVDEYTVIWRRPKVITPDEPSEEPEDPLIMGEEELITIPEKDKSSVENLVPIPSEFKGISDDMCDVDPSTFDALAILLDLSRFLR
ncbi:hypothetical protein Tco_0417582 [Tanacetum coccineum]